MPDIPLLPDAVPFDRYRHTTAEIIYRMPDYLDVLQSFIWQHLDIAPDFPVLQRFLEYWEQNIDGPIHSVQVTRARLVRPADLRHARHLTRLQ